MSGRKGTKNKEARGEFKLRLVKSRLAMVEVSCDILCTTRSADFDQLLDLAPLARDRHQIAEDTAALQVQLWEVQRMDREGRLDHELAQTIVKHIDDVARQITQRLRLGE